MIKMTSAQISNHIDRIGSAVEKHSYTVALMQLQSLAEATSSPWDIRRRIEELFGNYRLLKDYALTGYQDEQRRPLLASIAREVIDIASLIQREAEIAENSSIYFSTVRYERLKTEDTLESLAQQYYKRLSVYNMAIYGNNPERINEIAREVAELESRLFNRVWTTHPLSDADAEAIDQLLKSEVSAYDVKRLIVSALMLGALQYFDERRLWLLTDHYERNHGSRDALQALCALLLSLWNWRDAALSSRFSSRLSLMMETPDVTKEIQMIFSHFLQTNDTERITRKINEELLPDLMKMRPDMKKMSELQELGDMSDVDINPEWEKMLHDSGIEDKLKELNEIQMEGGDLMIGTFSHLKTFPFFNNTVNWFRAFNTSNPELPEIGNRMVSFIESAPMLCDSDRYSLAFSITNLPAQVKGFMDAAPADLKEQMAEISEAGKQGWVREYLQSIYRFFTLYRRKGDFVNPFATKVNLFAIPSVATAIKDEQMIRVVAEFYLNRGYYNEALSALLMLPSGVMNSSADLLQKAGFCLQKTGNIDAALEYYEKSELLNGNNTWVIRRIAFCHKSSGNPSRALEYFNRLLERKPDDVLLNLNAGHCLMELGRYDEALNRYFKVEFLEENSSRVQRPIAWCTFLAGDYRRSESYYRQILSSTPKADDWLNFGHLNMAMCQYREAVKSYTKALEANGRDYNRLSVAVAGDRRWLDGAGVDTIMLDLVLDEVESTLFV